MVNEVDSKDLVCYLLIARVEELLDELACNGFVLFRHAATKPLLPSLLLPPRLSSFADRLRPLFDNHLRGASFPALRPPHHPSLRTSPRSSASVLSFSSATEQSYPDRHLGFSAKPT